MSCWIETMVQKISNIKLKINLTNGNMKKIIRNFGYLDVHTISSLVP